MNIKKITFISLICVGILAFILLIIFFFNRNSNPTPEISSVAATTTSTTSPSETPSSGETNGSPDELDTTLHTETEQLLKQSPYNAIIDKTADFSLVDIYLDGNLLSISDKPFKYKGRLYLPLRQVGECLGIKIDFNDEHKVALAESAEYRLEMPLKYRYAVKIPLANPNLASTIAIDSFNNEVSILFYKEKTYLPVRFTAEALGFAVKYEEKKNAVYFTSPV